VVEQHSRTCRLSRRSGRRCTCTPGYVARVQHAGRAYTATFATLAEAVAWRETTRRRLRAGRLPDRPGRSATVGELACCFLARARDGQALTRSRRRYSQATLDLYERDLRLYVLAARDERSGLAFADLPAGCVSSRTVQALVDRLTVEAGGAVARHAAAALSAVLRDGYVRGLVDQPPPRVILPPPPAARTRTLTPADADELLAAAGRDDAARGRSLVAPLVALLAGTGCRIGEALGLDWGPGGLDLDADPPVARIRRETTKTDAGAREIVLDRETAALLRRHRLASGRPADGTPVFCDERGRRLARSGRVRFGLRRAAAAAGLPGVTPHVLRHAHATWLALSPTVPDAAAARRLGHADAGFYQRRYVHAGDADQTAVVEALAAYRASHRCPA